jgi:hypothetical protein
LDPDFFVEAGFFFFGAAVAARDFFFGADVAAVPLPESDAVWSAPLFSTVVLDFLGTIDRL